MRMKKMLKRAGSFAMALAVLIGSGLALLPQISDGGIVADAATVNEQEGNGSLFDANIINIGDTILGHAEPGDGDFFKFIIPDSGKISIKLKAYMWKIGIFVYDSEGNVQFKRDEIEWDKTIQMSNNTFNLDLTSGTYYIFIRESFKSTGDYEFVTSFTPANESFHESEGGTNNSLANANNIDFDTKYTGQLAVNDGIDFYRFTLSNKTTVNINLVSYTERINFYLYDSDGNNVFNRSGWYWIEEDKVTHKIDFSKEFELPEGSYYIAYEWTFRLTGNYEFSVSIPNVSSIKLNQTDVTLSSGKSITLSVEIEPSNAYDDIISWSSSNTSVAIVSNGKITAKNPGTATITAKTSNGKTATCTVTVKNPVLATKITLTKSAATLKKGETVKIKATVSPSNATDKTVTWTSSNTSVATVSNGTVTAKATGTSTITAKTSNGKTATCTVRVVADNYVVVTGMIMNKSNITLGQNEAYQLNAGIYPPNASDKSVTWTTSDSSIVTVTTDGKITGKKNGTAVIMARSVDGKKTTCNVTVKNAPSKVSVSQTGMTLKVGQKGSLDYILPDGCGCGKCVFRSSDSSVVKMIKTLDKATFKAVKKGTAYVIAKTYNGKEAKCKITVV